METNINTEKNSYEKLTSIEYSYNEKKHNVLVTISKMLIERKIINDSYNNILNTLTNSLNSNTDNIAIYKDNINNIEYVIKFINRNAATLKKVPEIENFISSYQSSYKFLIINSMSPKVQKLLANIINLEVFLLNEVVVNIIDHDLVPKHRLLTLDEKEKFMLEYDIKNKDMPRIYNMDPIARYYGAKIGDVFEIERVSTISGKSISYRLVVPGVMV